MILRLVITGVAAFILGYWVCAWATWARIHRQESEVRALLVAIQVLCDMDAEVPPEWVIDQLTQLVVKEDR